MTKIALLGGAPARSTPLSCARPTMDGNDLAAVTDTLAADLITQGPVVARFERALAERARVQHAVAVANGQRPRMPGGGPRPLYPPTPARSCASSCQPIGRPTQGKLRR